MEVIFSNSNSLFFVDKAQLKNGLSIIKANLASVLFSAWELDEIKLKSLDPLVKKLINLGCKCFVCAGTYSELLHDSIDNIISDMSIGGRQENYRDIITSWHDTDSDDEVADFFLYSMNVSNMVWLAFLDEGNSSDNRLKAAILKAIDESVRP
ncbi:hypothetical protein [Methylomonas sp. UP202]|uniref:DUF7684 family protein n=1 Tax=Methylomonas sp. UP202 TaxID=3040943 RepID=UPI00143A0E65|nr:hypothetical protein [Methylomonas sp. UP202]NJA04225.1 hypothetical protein [Methylococcaceae bacterium WWC4]WGS87486.1 hypothetical protein QC632_06945 [Methylomonas sp. UP202]